MAEHERAHASLTLDDEDEGRFNATWSRSHKSLIITVSKQNYYDENRQVLLRPDQVEKLIVFLRETS